MHLLEHYNSLYQASKKEILAGKYGIDLQIDSTADDRFGITLLIRPDAHVKRNIQAFLHELKQVEPTQYYYPDSDLHVTAMSIISCYSGFRLEGICIEDYVRVIKESLIGIAPFKIEFRGVTASPSAVMIQGFPCNASLHNLRNNLRYHFQQSGLEESIDKRYAISTAHVTVARFRDKLQGAPRFVNTLEKYREYLFGQHTVDRLELVCNDWYQRAQYVKKLHHFDLG